MTRLHISYYFNSFSIPWIKRHIIRLTTAEGKNVVHKYPVGAIKIVGKWYRPFKKLVLPLRI